MDHSYHETAIRTDNDGKVLLSIDLKDPEFKRELKAFIYEIINDIAEGQLLDKPLGADDE